MQRLAVPGHVFICVDGDYVVFLDVRNDRYWAVERARTAGLAQQVLGWPSPEGQSEREDIGHDTAGATLASTGNERGGGDAEQGGTDTADLLLKSGLLCDAALLEERRAAPARIALPRAELVGIATMSAAVGAAAAMRLVLAAMSAAAGLKFRRFEDVIERARQRRRAHSTAGHPLDMEAAARLVCGFERLRPLLFSARGACLFNSLALIEFLARQGCYPQWVFGVQARPFAAHCWVQQDGIVFNDSVEHVRRYTPIMVV